MFTVRIDPDCASEAISAPVGAQTMLPYTIYDTTYSYSFNDFTLSRTFCSISTYEVSYDLDAGDFVSYNSASRTFNVQTDDNKFGDATFTITITGITDLGVIDDTDLNFRNTISFTFSTIKMCGNVELTASSFLDPIYYYALLSAAYSFSVDKFSQSANGH